MATGKLPYVTWQKLKRDKVPYEQWPEYAFKAYTRASGGINSVSRSTAWLIKMSNGMQRPAGDSAKLHDEK